jgi:DNA processing protein
MREIQTRLALFAAIEGGHVYWSQEIATYGSDHVYKKLIEGGYDGVKFAKTIERLRAVKRQTKYAKSIDSAGAIFLTPEMAQWPEQLNELAAPPIGLIVKGDS